MYDHVRTSAQQQHTEKHNGSTKLSRSPTDVLRAAILWYQEGEASRLHVHDEASAPAAWQDGEGRGKDMKTSLAPFLSHFPARMRVHSWSCGWYMRPVVRHPFRRIAHKFELPLLTRHTQSDRLHWSCMTNDITKFVCSVCTRQRIIPYCSWDRL